MAKVIIVANRLPITIGKTLRRSSGGLVSALTAASDDEMVWIGWPGTDVSHLKQLPALKQRLLNEFHCVPVCLTPKEIADYYHGFSNACLWPVLHYFPHYVHYASVYWDAYMKINRKFAEQAARQAGPGDVVWVHDYHLFLVPQMLREMRPDLKIGFFLHTPFPSFEVFRCLPHREDVLRGILGADLVGFQTYGYLRHFRSSVIRLLNIDSEMDRILCRNRFCRLGVFPVGINVEEFASEIESARFLKRKRRLRSVYAGQRIVLGVERVDYSKGILRRLDAIEKFLKSRKRVRDVVFIFIGIPTRGEVKEYRDLLYQIQKRISEINSQYGDIEYAPINFINRTIPFADLCALYSVADVAMITPLIDGMNLVAKEYVMCKNDSTGVVLLSEFAGAAHELFNAVQVNPYNIDETARKLAVALGMPEEEKRERLLSMRDHVIRYGAGDWARVFLSEIRRTETAVECFSAGFDHPDNGITRRIRSARRVAFFLDYDGTLREFEDLPGKASPGKGLLALISSLAAVEGYDVGIISGRARDDLAQWFKGLGVTLIAEHGYSVLRPGLREWEILGPEIDFSWKANVRKIFSQYVATTPGAFIEEKAASVVWHFRKADPEFGRWKSQQLLGNLLEILANENVVVHQGQAIVEVSSNQINKGAAVRRLIDDGDYDCVVCAGDDKTDETMFRLDDPRIISIKIGGGETYARYRLESPEVLREFLTALIRKGAAHG